MDIHRPTSVLLVLASHLLFGCSEKSDFVAEPERVSAKVTQATSPSESASADSTSKEQQQTQSPADDTTLGRFDKTRHDSLSSAEDVDNRQFDWPHWRGPDRNGISRETGLIREFPVNGPKVGWRATLGTGFSGLTISGGRVLTLFGEGGREKVVCFDANTGREIWKIDSDADFAQGRSFGPRATPCVDGNQVYAVGASGKIHCLEAETGKQTWSFNIYDKFSMRPHEEGLSCSPIVDGKKLIMLVGTSVFAFNKSDGKLIWRALEEKMNHTSPTFATFGGRRQLIVLSGSNLVGLDPESGKELWRHAQRGVNCATPVIGPNNQIFTAASYGFGCQLVKVSGGSATQVYKNNALATHHATAMLHEGHLYGFHDRPGIFKCIEFETGKEKWASRSPGKGKLIIADGQMIILTEYGEVALAKPSPDGYTETSKARIVKGTSYTAPTLANGKLYVRSDKEMVCIEMKEQ